jgi:molybdopterin-binding protein
VELPGGVRLFVGFSAPDGARVELTFDPESVLLAPARFPSSARNVFRGRIFRMRALNAETIRVELAVGRVRFPALVTPHSVEALHLKVGGHAYLYLKATALRAAGRPL